MRVLSGSFPVRGRKCRGPGGVPASPGLLFSVSASAKAKNARPRPRARSESVRRSHLHLETLAHPAVKDVAQCVRGPEHRSPLPVVPANTQIGRPCGVVDAPTDLCARSPHARPEQDGSRHRSAITPSGHIDDELKLLARDGTGHAPAASSRKEDPARLEAGRAVGRRDVGDEPRRGAVDSLSRDHEPAADGAPPGKLDPDRAVQLYPARIVVRGDQLRPELPVTVPDG